MENRKELIKLAHANVTQITSGADRSEWILKENKTSDILGELPSKLNEKEVFAILNLARKYELDAFNTGIEFGKKKYKDVCDPQIAQLEELLRMATNENERLADVLENISK